MKEQELFGSKEWFLLFPLTLTWILTSTLILYDDMNLIFFIIFCAFSSFTLLHPSSVIHFGLAHHLSFKVMKCDAMAVLEIESAIICGLLLPYYIRTALMPMTGLSFLSFAFTQGFGSLVTVYI